jgi:hypothetical protein
MLDLSSEGFAIAGGVFDTGAEGVAERLSNRKDLGVSHGFSYESKTRSGEILGYETFEISPLPLEKAANSYTGFLIGDKETEEGVMTLDPAKRAFLVENMGAEKVSALEEGLGRVKALADQEGVTFKEVLDGLAAVDGDQKDDESSQDDQDGSKDGDGTQTVAVDASNLSEALQPVISAIETLAQGQADQAAEIKALREGRSEEQKDDEDQSESKSVADQIAAAMRPRGTGIYIPSEADGNVIHGNSKDAQAVKPPASILDTEHAGAMTPQIELLALATRQGQPLAQVVENTDGGASDA